MIARVPKLTTMFKYVSLSTVPAISVHIEQPDLREISETMESAALDQKQPLNLKSQFKFVPETIPKRLEH